MTELFAEINGHRVMTLSRVTTRGWVGAVPVCIECGTHFTDRREIENSPCPAAGTSHGHDIVVDPDDGLLYCQRCPLVAYDVADLATEPNCPIPLQSWGDPER